ncbi:MAG TPA: hypothetical protein VFL97_10215 [Nitrococcus sp.]|nr:hypothetical protein [Nitrococcus sp.]
MLLTGVLCTPGIAAAQSGGSASPDALNGPTRQKLLDTRDKLQKLHRQLEEISDAALRHNPPLQKQEGKLRDLVFNTMKASGYEPEKDVAHIKELATKLRSENIDANQKNQLITDYQQTQARLIAAQREALNNAEVREARQTYQDQMRQAMAKENPNSEALIRRYQETRMELQRELEGAAKSQGQDGR